MKKEEAEKIAVSANLSFFLSLSLVLSPVAARGVSGQRFPALIRWLPGFQSQVPAEIIRGQNRFIFL